MAGELVLKFRKGKLVSGDVNGVAGPNCLKETEKFLAGLNLNPEDYDDRHKPEFDQQTDVLAQGQG